MGNWMGFKREQKLNISQKLTYRLHGEKAGNMKLVAFRITPMRDFYRVIDFDGMALIERKLSGQKYDICGECLPTSEAIEKLKSFVFAAK